MAATPTSAPPIVASRSTAAAMLECSAQHVDQLIERGVLRRVRIEGSALVRIPVEDIYRAAGMEPPTQDEAPAGAA